LKVFELQGTLI